MSAQNGEISFPARIGAFNWRDKAFYVRVPKMIVRALPNDGLYQVTLRLIGTLSTNKA